MMTSIPGTWRARISSSERSGSSERPLWDRQITISARSSPRSNSTIWRATVIGSSKVTGDAKGATSAAAFPMSPNRPIRIPSLSITRYGRTIPRAKTFSSSSSAALSRLKIALERTNGGIRPARSAVEMIRARPAGLRSNS